MFNTFRSNYRARIDLSNYFNDERKFAYVFILSNQMENIEGLKKHIAKLFNINTSFDLLHNGTTFLPPNEYIDIILPNDSILVVPKADAQNNGTLNNVSLSHKNDTSVENKVEGMCEVHNQTKFKNKEVQVNICGNESATLVFNSENMQIDVPKNFTGNTSNISEKSKIYEASKISENNETQYLSFDSNDGKIDMKPLKKKAKVTYSENEPNKSTTNRMQSTGLNKSGSIYHSFVEEAEDNKNEIEEGDNITEDISNLRESYSLPKRRRVRKKKLKRQQELVCSDSSSEKPKPKIINDSLMLSSGKHIRFDSQQINDSTLEDSPSTTKIDTSKDLLTLLSLRNSSTPITFISQKQKRFLSQEANLKNDIIRPENSSDKESQVSKYAEECAVSENKRSDSIKVSDLLKMEDLPSYLENLPNMSPRVQLYDKIAFKMYKMGPHYSPETSNFIIGEVVFTSPNSKTSAIRLIKGKEEVHLPIGKFSLPDEETDNLIDDTITINDVQLITPKLIERYQ